MGAFHSDIGSWRTWFWQRVLVPLAIAVSTACTVWNATEVRQMLVWLLATFAVAVWTVILRAYSRRALVSGDCTPHRAIRSWHALDLFSAVILVMFEFGVAVCADEFAHGRNGYVLTTAVFLGLYIAISASGQHILNGVLGSVVRDEGNCG